MRVHTQPHVGTIKELTPLYAESINMLDSLADDEVDRYLEEHLKIVPLFEVGVAEAVTPYVTYREKEFDEPDQEAILELRQVHESLEREMIVSQRVKASKLEEVDLGTSEGPKPVNVAKEMPWEENGDDRIAQRFLRCVGLVLRGYARVGSQNVPTSDPPQQGCKAGSATTLPNESQLCG